MVRVIALHSVIPLRAEPSEASEMLTQMLFGETADVLEDARRWTRISLHQDGQEGWADTKMLTPLSDSEWTEHQRNEMVALAAHNNFIPRVALPMTYAVSENNGQTLPLTAGTRLPSYANGVFSLLGVRFRIDPQAVLVAPMPFSFDSLMKTTRFFLNLVRRQIGVRVYRVDMRVVPELGDKYVKLGFELGKVFYRDAFLTLSAALHNARFSYFRITIQVNDQRRIHHIAAHVREKLGVHIDFFSSQNAVFSEHFHKTGIPEKA